MAELFQGAPAPLFGNQQNEPLGWGEGFAKSFAWSFPELVGVQTPPRVQDWRGSNPVSSFGSQVLGMAIPYLGWEAAATKIPAIANTVNKVASAEKLAEAPFRAAAAREMVKFAPFEAGRVVAGALGGSALADALDTTYAGTGDLATEAATNLGAAGVIGGALQAWKAAGKADANFSDVFTGANLKDPPQLRFRAIRSELGNNTIAPDYVPVAQAQLNQLGRDVRLERPSSGESYISMLDGKSKQATQAINSLFKPTNSPLLERNMLVESPRHFKSRTELDTVLADANMPTDWEAYVKTPRYLATDDAAASAIVNRTITRNMQSVGSGAFLARDAKDGFFVMAKEIPPNAAAPNKSRWMLFKTDTPDMFAPASAQWANYVGKKAQWLDDYMVPGKATGASVLDTALGAKQLEVVDVRGLRQSEGTINQLQQKMQNALGISGEPSSELVKRTRTLAREYLEVAQNQFKDSPLANHVQWAARQAQSAAEALAREKFFGKFTLRGQSTVKAILKGAEPQPSQQTIDQLVDTLYKDHDAVKAFHEAVANELSPVQAAVIPNMSADGMTLLQRLDDLAKWNATQIETTHAAFGIEGFVPRENYYMIPHRWKGDWRVPMWDENNKLVSVAAGVTREAAQKEAAEIAAQWPSKLTLGIPGRNDFKADQMLREQLAVRRDITEMVGRRQAEINKTVAAPGTVANLRTGVSGYIGADAPWRKDELKQLILGKLQQDQKYLADLSVRKLYEKELTTLNQSNFDTYRQLSARLDDLAGGQQPFAKLTNQMVDKVLAPVLGNNSASRLVGTMNQIMANLSFGWGNIAYPLANMLTFMQTALPQISFVTSLPPSRMAKYYSWWLTSGAKTVDGVGMLDMLKLAKQSFKELGSPDASLRAAIERGANEGVWDPAFIEEAVGVNSKLKQNLSEALKGNEPLSTALGRLGMWLPAQGEKLSRAHTFTLGYIVGRDIFQFQDDLLYRFAKEFTEKTQYLYGQADRSRVFTGPFGSAMGLFKSWMMHYTSWWMEYLGEGVKHGNWKPFLWANGGTMALGGIGALPFVETANGISNWLSGKSVMNNLYSGFGTDEEGERSIWGDGIYYGLPAFLGMSLQGQVSAPFNDPGRDALHLMNFAYVDRAKAVGRAMGAAMDNWTTNGTHPGTDPQFRDAMMRAFLPKTLYQLGSVDWSTGTVRNLTTGNPTIKGLSTPELLKYTMGMAAPDVDISFRVSNELWQDQAKAKLQVQRFGQSWAEAVQAGDSAALRHIVSSAIAHGVDLSSVIKSAKSNLAKGREDVINRQFSPQAIMEYRQSGLVR